MNWKKLETFKNISKFKSFNHASKILNKSQSSFSRDIMSLEKDLGFKLFNRHMKTGIHPQSYLTSSLELQFEHAILFDIGEEMTVAKAFSMLNPSTTSDFDVLLSFLVLPCQATRTMLINEVQ